ncbi:MAG: PadR family transcriptional regulator [Kiritimatiellae bacterium]|nr:PadR family transcriptional regulator [Kiritimatiellia bacterium]
MEYTNPAYWKAMMDASLCRLLILRIVCERPRHGYGIIWRAAELTNHQLVPTQGTIYPVLRDLARSGCLQCRIERTGRRERRVYRATSRGRQALRAGAGVWRRGLARLQALLGPARSGPGDDT